MVTTGGAIRFLDLTGLHERKFSSNVEECLQGKTIVLRVRVKGDGRPN